MSAFAYNISAGKDVSSINPRLITNVSEYAMTDIKLPTSPKFVNLAGKRYGRLLVIRYAGKIEPNSHLWECLCDCGNTKISRRSVLINNSVSCGCYKKESNFGSKTHFKPTHGMAKTSIYMIWRGIIARCKNPKTTYYHRYGGRGITICDRWATSFENFYADMGERPSSKHSIDRIDNNGNYEPDNCKWSTPKEQQQNSSTSRNYTVDGITLSMAGWSRALGVPKSSFRLKAKVMGDTVAAIKYYQDCAAKHHALAQAVSR